MLSVTMDDGLVPRGSRDRKTNGELVAEQHLLVRKDDIAYNMMRMWQGASGLASEDGLVSPAYVVVAPRAGIDPEFAAYWFKSERMIHLFWAYSHGITGDRLRLYYKDFAKIPVTVPPVSEQRRIARILTTTDRAIERTRQLIAANLKLRKGIADQLLSGRYRLSGFGDPSAESMSSGTEDGTSTPLEWSCVRFGSLGTTYSGLGSKTKEDFGSGQPYIPYLNVFDNMFVDPQRLDRVRIGGDESQNEVRCGDIFFTTSSETPLEVGMASVLLHDLPGTYLNSFCFGFRLHSFDRLLPEFAGHLLRSDSNRRAIARLSQGATRYNLPRKAIMELPVALPPMAEQEAITSVLSKANREVQLLATKLARLQDTRKGFMQKLLSDKHGEPSECSQP